MDLSGLTSKITPRRIIFLLVLLAAAFAIYMLATHAFLEVTAEGTASGELNYQIVNQSSKKAISLKTSSTKVKKLVPKGSYEVSVSQNNKSYFSVVRTKGFLLTARTGGELQQERARQFVGDNPGSCMDYLFNVLLSFGCNGILGTAYIHKPASAGVPTLTQRIPNSIYPGYIESTFSTKEGSFVLAKSVGDNDVDVSSSHHVYSFGPGLTITRSADLPDLITEKTYTAVPYKDGFVVYDSTFRQVLYYGASTAKPQTLNIESPKDTKLTAAGLQVSGDKLAVVFTHSTEAGDKKPSSEVVMTDGKTTTRWSFSKNYGSAEPCGTNKLCMLSADQLDVYDITGKKPAFLYSVTDAKRLAVSGTTSLVVFRSKDVLNLDVDTRAGYIGYSLGDYKFNNVVVSGNNYILSLSRPNGKKVALYIDQNTPDTNQIDKKVLGLEKAVGVTAVSAYGKYIIVSPNVGTLVRTPAGFDYDPAVRQASVNRINQAVKDLAIDTNTYSVSSQ